MTESDKHTGKENPQKKQSRQWLVDSLLDIMKTKPYKDITVSELSAHADLARRTFYRHFSTMEEVLDSTLQQLCDEFAAYFVENQPKRGDLHNMIYIYFTFWEQHKEFLLILQKNDMMHLLLKKVLPQARNEIRSALLNGNVMEENTQYLEYASYFTEGGAWNLMVKWLGDGAVLTPEEMADIVDIIIRTMH